LVLRDDRRLVRLGSNRSPGARVCHSRHHHQAAARHFIVAAAAQSFAQDPVDPPMITIAAPQLNAVMPLGSDNHSTFALGRSSEFIRRATERL
jgi:hypothetical protein